MTRKRHRTTEATEDESNAPILAEVGASGLRHWAGYIEEEYHKDLQGAKAAKVYREMMDGHPLIGVGMFVIDLFARRVPLWVEAAGTSPQDIEAKKLVESALEDVQGGMPNVFSQGITALPYGWAYLEKVYKICRGKNKSKVLNSKFDDGKLRWRKLRICGQESLDRWDMDTHGEVLGLWQRAAPDYKLRYVSRSKAMHIRMFNRKDNPEGFSFLRPAYTPYYFQKNLQVTEAVGVYRNVAGFPRIKLPLEIMAAAAGTPEAALRDSYLEMGKKVAGDEYACVVMPTDLDRNGNPTGYAFDLVTSSGRNLAETDPIIRRYRTEIAVVMMMQFLLLGEKAGSYSLAENMFEMAALVIESIIDSVLQALNQDAVRELVYVNGLPPESAPEVKHGRLAPPDLAKLGAFVTAVMSSGAVTPDDNLEAHLREDASWPEKDEDSERASATAVPGVGEGFMP